MEISHSFDTLNGQSLRNQNALVKSHRGNLRPVNCHHESIQSLRREEQLENIRSTLRSLRSQRHPEPDTNTLRSEGTLLGGQANPLELLRDELYPPRHSAAVSVPIDVIAAVRNVVLDGRLNVRTIPRGGGESRSSSRRSSFRMDSDRRQSQHSAPRSRHPSFQGSLRHRKHDEDSMSAFSRCWLGILVLVAQILLNGVMALCLFWVIQYHSQDGVPFAWKSNPKLEFNLHPVLMIAGFIYFMGQAMILYRTCRCCRRIWNKLLHTILHILAIPCIVIGFIAVLDSHNLRKDKDGNPAPIPNFYSLHSWIGLTVMGLFALQFVIGFFSFLLLLCCESATASFRANLVPIHAAFGGTTFVLAVAAACTGLTEKAFFSLSLAYSKWVPYLSDRNFEASTALTGLTKLGPEYTQEIFEQSLVINALGAGLVALAIVIPVILAYPKFRYRPQRVITVTHDRYG